MRHSKLEQAARQALEALEKHQSILGLTNNKQDTEAITALREALSEQATVSGGLCGGCAKKAVDGWVLYCVECWEKAEQEQPEPEDICQEPDGCPTEKAVLQRFWREKQAEQEPVAWVWLDDWLNDGYPEDCFSRVNHQNKTPLYASPVRTKDLTDDEIVELIEKHWDLQRSLPDFARAVIAADREKNK